MDRVKIKSYLLDTIKVDSPEHRGFKIFSTTSFEGFPVVLGTRINAKTEQNIDILIMEKLVSFQLSSITNQSQRIQISFDILKAIWLIHQKQFFMGAKGIQNFLVYNNEKREIKFKAFHSISLKQFKFEEPKKDKNIAKNGIQLCFQIQKLPYQLDVWKWAVLTTQMLYTFSLEKYIEKAFTCEKIQQFAPEIAIKNNFLGANQFQKMLEKCLKISPKQRPQIQQIIKLFQKIIINKELTIDEQSIIVANQQHFIKDNQIRAEMAIEISQNILLTDELKKKLGTNFVKNGLKAPKSYKPLFRATRFKFSTRVYYEQCVKQSKVMFVIDTEEAGVICCYIEPTITYCETKGLVGEFIPDPSLKSFIYSVKKQESYKLIHKDKAYKSVPGHGPIIGDEDIILGGDKDSNWSYFPKSYQPGKHKKLTPKAQFSIRNYDVYTVIF